VPGTLLIGNPDTTWREWLKEFRGGRDFLCLDPGDPAQGMPGRICLFRGTRPIFARFYGSLDAQRFPHVLLAALAEALPLAEGELVVQSFAYKPSPLTRHLTTLVAQLIQPESILVASSTSIDLNGFPVGPTLIDIEKAFPRMVQEAQRKAQWMKLLENCTKHVIPFKTVSFEGARLGSGVVLDSAIKQKIGLEEVLHAEVCGSSLFVVTDAEIDEAKVSRALDLTHTSRPTFVRPDAYENLLCSFVRQSGEDFGFGIVQTIDWRGQELTVLNDAVPPAPVRMVRLGAIRIDPKGRELEEARPWQV
jgi:hypothetical protein